jgi:hypothetical protein
MNDIEDMTIDIERSHATLDLCDIPKVNQQGRPLSLRIRVGMLALQGGYTTINPGRVDEQVRKNREEQEDEKTI